MLPPTVLSSSSLAECSLVERAATGSCEPIVVDDWLGEILVRQWAAQRGGRVMAPCEAA